MTMEAIVGHMHSKFPKLKPWQVNGVIIFAAQWRAAHKKFPSFAVIDNFADHSKPPSWGEGG